MRDTVEILEQLASRVCTARVSGMSLSDATDFKAWLMEIAEAARHTSDNESLLKYLDKNVIER